MIALLILLALVELLQACRMWFRLLALQRWHSELDGRLLAVEHKVKSRRKERT